MQRASSRQSLSSAVTPSVQPVTHRSDSRNVAAVVDKSNETKSRGKKLSLAKKSDPDAKFRDGLLSLMPFLRAFSHSLCRNHELAEDLAQEALCKAWEARARFRIGSNLKAWLFTILRNEFCSHGRRAWRQESWDVAETFGVRGPDEPQDWAVQLSDTVRAIHVLPSEQREALILAGLGGFGYTDAAAITRCPEGTMKSRVARARKKILTALEDLRQPRGARPPIGCAAREVMRELDRVLADAQGSI